MKRLMTMCLLFLSISTFAQENKKAKDPHLPEGNKKFVKKEYASAEADYRMSASNAPTKSAAAYNLGNAIYRQGSVIEAGNAYGKAIKNARTKQEKHMAYHNIGNVLMKEKDYRSAVSAYREALRNNPADEQTRYNYALAKKMLKDNPGPQQEPEGNSKQKEGDNSQNPNKGDGDDNKKDKKDSDPNGQQNDQKQRLDQQKGQGNNDKKPNKGGGDEEKKAEQGPSKQRIQNLLDAMDNEEKKVQERVNKGKVQGQPARQEKDW